MEENKAKTTAAEEEIPSMHVDGTDAVAVTSAQGAAETNHGTEEAHGIDGAGETESGTPKTFNTQKSGSDADEASTADVNRANARRRREAERAKELTEARESAIIEALDGINPYTGEEMKDSAAVEKFLSMKEERAKAAADAPPVGSEEWFRRDREDFCEAHPDVSMEELIRDPRFTLFSEGKVGHLPMEEIYAGYRELLSHFDERAKNLAAQTVANRMASPGNLGSTGSAESDHFSPDQVRRMSANEVRENYQRIRASMATW